MFGYRPPQKPIAYWKIVLGDQVIVNTGAYKGAKGKVTKIFRDKNKVVVQGVNMKYKKVEDDEYERRKKVIHAEAPIHVSNVSLIDP